MNVTAAKIAEEFGFTARHWTRHASTGNIPGVYQPSGPGGHWLFDIVVFRRWLATRQREVTAWGSTKEAQHIGRAPNVREPSTAEALRREIASWQRQGSPSG